MLKFKRKFRRLKVKITRGENIVKFIKYFRLRWCGHVKRIQNQRMPKQIAAVTAEGVRNRRRPRTRWRDEVERDLTYNGNKKQEMASIKVHNRL